MFREGEGATGEEGFSVADCWGADALASEGCVTGMPVLLSGMANPRIDAQSVIEFVVYCQ